ncbi:MAG: exodeoxyribonuclease V subunit beta [Saccharospirillum sp.]
MPDAPQHLNAATLPLSGRQLIEASAGTGKTYNITRLYLRLLLEAELSVEQILVMTFTRAATAELKGRLAELIRQTHDHWGESEEPFFQALYPRIGANKARALLHRALLNLDEAAVYTIHSFCKRALTQQAFASGISFHAAMEADSHTLILEALQDWYRREARGEQFASLQRCWATPDDFAKDWQFQIGNGETIEEPQLDAPEAEWAAFCRTWAEEAEAFEQLNVRPRRSEAAKQQWRDTLTELTDWSQAPWPGEAPELFNGKFLKDGFGTAKKAAALPNLHALAEKLAAYNRDIKAWWAWQGITFAREHLHANKDRLDQLDFNDLILTLRDRLTDADSGPALAQALAQQFPAALVDEFQDTDPDQYAILDALYPRRTGNDAQIQTLLCMIGDPKQAIYGFRGGDVFAYLQARDAADAQWMMDTNYRSHPEVIRGYNRLFYGADLSATKGVDVFGFGIDYFPVQAGLKDLADLTDPAERSAFQWCVLPNDNPESKGYTKDAGMALLADWTAGEITRLLQQAQLDGRAVEPGDIAILVRSKGEAEIMQQALRQQRLASVYLSARDNVLHSPEAESLALALNGILNLENDRALVAALATPWFGHSTESLYRLQADEHAWAETLFEVAELRERWLNQGLMSMALALFQRHVHPLAQRHERTLTNCLHLLELLQTASQQHKQPWQLLHWFDQARQDDSLASIAQLRLESDAHLIQVVTQHGAKGLEYPIVFLPFVSYGRRPKGTPMLVRYHDRDNYEARLAMNPNSTELDWYQEEDAAEDIRLLYVAATRAQRRLYLLAAEFTDVKRSSLARCLRTETFADTHSAIGRIASELQQPVLNLLERPQQRAPAPEAAPAAAPTAAQFNGRIERDWWLSSFSALTRNARHGGLTTPDRDQDEPEQAASPSRQATRFSLARGAEAGNLLHDLLERLNFAEPDFDSALAWAEDRYPALVPPGENATENPVRAGLIAWLQDILATKLPSGARLQDLPPQSVLCEAAFYFPMHSQRMGLSRLLARHRGETIVHLPEPPRLKGMMHGFIDLIYQWQGRYYVVDYKSTWLGDRLSDYNEAALTESVRTSFYDLQYLLYSLALHRYLRTRLPDYDPAQHLGGVHYLYLRGMTEGQSSGIYHRDTDLDTLMALDALFTGAETPA